MSDWTTARSAHGPKVAAYIDGILEERETYGVYFGETFARQLSKWRDGSHANFYSLDKVLSKLNIHPSELPDDVWSDHASMWLGRKLAEAA